MTTSDAIWITYHICECCVAHGDAKLLADTVTCVECGLPCSCEGCIAERDSQVTR